MSTNPHNEDRLLELLADQATEGLDAIRARELDSLLNDHPDNDIQSLEREAAAFDLAMMPSIEEQLPDTLRDRILSDAMQFFENEESQTTTSTESAGVAVIKFEQASRAGRSGRMGWFVAAASLVLAVAGWWPSLTQNDVTAPDVMQEYAQFKQNTTDIIQAPWQGEEPGYEKVTGNVVWSDLQQMGYMKLVGLPQNDPQEKQYQLWIVDPDRDKNPVDGGVFNVDTNGEIVIPIDAKLNVDKPTKFAITLEQPGGVVVSAGPLLVIGTTS